MINRLLPLKVRVRMIANAPIVTLAHSQGALKLPVLKLCSATDLTLLSRCSASYPCLRKPHQFLHLAEQGCLTGKRPNLLSPILFFVQNAWAMLVHSLRCDGLGNRTVFTRSGYLSKEHWWYTKSPSALDSSESCMKVICINTSID
jgi:hypothetical protein